MNKHAQYTADRLRTATRSKNAFGRLAWIVAVLALMTFALLAAALVDYWLLLPAGGRIAGAALVALLGVAGVFRFIQMIRRPARLKDVALDLETERPELGCVISTATEYLDGTRQPGNAYEPELVDALHEQAAKSLLLVETPYHRPLLKAGALGIAAVAAAGLFFALAPGAGTALERILLPLRPLTYTTIEVRPGNTEIALGRDVEIQCAFSGRIPKDARLLWRMETNALWQIVTLTNVTDGTASHTFPNVRKPIFYRVNAGDATSADYEVALFIPPAVKEARVRIDFPEYTKLSPVVEAAENFSALRGSSLDFQIATSGNIASARLRFANLPELDLHESEPGLWTARATAVKDAFYWVELIDSKGRAGGNEKPFQMVVLPDEAPQVDIPVPGQDIRADHRDKIKIDMFATDDFGLESMRLVFRKMGSAEQSIPCTFTPGAREVTASAELDLAPLNLRDYEVVAYYVEAVDNNTLDGPGIGRSPTYFIEITTKEKALSQCRGSGQKINILALQKQVIAATMLVRNDSETDRMLDIATAQRETMDYAKIFKDSFILAISPPEATVEFDAAITEMDLAAQSLEHFELRAALGAEERALAHLYQVVKLLPDLEKMCEGQGNSTCTAIVLEAIEKEKREKKKQNNQEARELLHALQQLAEAQKQLAEQTRPEARDGSPQEPKKENGQAAGEQPGSRNRQALAQGRTGQGEDDEANNEEKQGAQAGRKDGEPRPGDSGSGELQRLAEEQRRLAEEAARLSERLARLARRDARLSNRHGSQLRATSENLRNAGLRLARHDRPEAAILMARGIHEVNLIIQALESLLHHDIRGAELANESYPREFERLISDYFRRLSHEE